MYSTQNLPCPETRINDFLLAACRDQTESVGRMLVGYGGDGPPAREPRATDCHEFSDSVPTAEATLEENANRTANSAADI